MSTKRDVNDPPLLADRKKCWQAKDQLWSCLDSNRGDQSKCDRSEYEKNCSKAWIAHFDRKYLFEKASLFDDEESESEKKN